jgi:putative flippase GtrA
VLSDFLNEHQKKIRFLIAGGINTAVGLAVYPILYLLLQPYGVSYLKALILAQIICITFSFISNKYFVFKTKGNIKTEYPKFFAFYGFYFVLNLICLPIMVEVLHLNPMVAQPLFSIAIVVSSYFWHSTITFKSIHKGVK